MPVIYFGLRRDSAMPADLRARLEAALPFEPDTAHTCESGLFTLYAWIKDPGLWPAAAWHQGAGSAGVHAGYGFRNSTDELLGGSAVEGATHLKDVWHEYRGEWSACRIGPEGISAVSSSVGTEHVYVARTPHFAAVSNRARLLWEAMKGYGERPTADLSTLASLLSVGYPVCTDATSVVGVRLLDSSSIVEIRDAGAPAIHSLGRAHLEPAETAVDWERLANAVVSNVSWLRHAPGPCLAALTGGKDSRLVLAALTRAGLRDKVRFYVSVPPDHADGLVAERIARRFELDFERRDVPSKRRFFDDIRAHVAFTEGALNAWDLKAGDDYVSQVGIHGLLGELYRGRGDVVSAEPRIAFRKLFGTLDIGGILDADVRRGEYARTRAWLERLGATARDASRLRDLFYLLQRIPRWMGQAKLRDGLSGLHLNPLYHPTILRAYARLTPGERTGERTHFELMLRLCAALTEQPFAGDRWAPEMVRSSSAPATRVATEPIEHARPMLGTGWQMPTLLEHWTEIRHRLSDGVERLRGVVHPGRLHGLLDAAAVVIGAKPSKVAFVRTLLRHPRLLRAAQRKPAAVAQQILGLLTIVALCDELEARTPSRVRVS